MASSRVTKQSGAMTEYQFQQLLEAVTEVLDPFKPASTFTRTPGQASIEKVIDSSTGIKSWQEVTNYLPIKFNITGGELNQFINALKEGSQRMVWNSHPTSGILTRADGNGTDLKQFFNYGKLRTSDIKVLATTYINEDKI